ncbi:hypothetical protein CISG_01933 [Coccidioides immitis RMSCC 3703]|uniref:Uncharacterized protein n=1 Tax=Coccidioides immitis RMSCC 3703 TaxID=454286 RepID=A0A0J8R522_COCIT|nr:hypothetical protein CISG_01933 [Coccidioides immitis RMSCC 3703]
MTIPTISDCYHCGVINRNGFLFENSRAKRRHPPTNIIYQIGSTCIRNELFPNPCTGSRRSSPMTRPDAKGANVVAPWNCGTCRVEPTTRRHVASVALSLFAPSR